MVTFRTLLARLPELTLVGPAEAIDAPIRWVHVSELADPTPYLRGDELVLSAGVDLPRSAAQLRRYVRRLSDFHVAGLGFGVQPIHREVPPELVRACAQHGLLLLEVPPTLPFIAISEALAAEVEADHLRELSRQQRAQQALVRQAGAQRPLEAVVRVLAQHLGAGVRLVELDTGRQWRAGPPIAAGAELDALLVRATGRAGAAAAALHEQGRHVLIHPIRSPAGRVALLVSVPDAPSQAVHAVVSVAVAVVTLVWNRAAAGTDSALGTALTACLAGAAPDVAERAVAAALGVRPGGQWRAVACAQIPPARSAAARRRWVEGLAAQLRTPLLDDDGESVIALVPDQAAAHTALSSIGPAGTATGVSAPCGWADAGGAMAQARQQLALARLTGRPTVHADAESVPLHGMVDADAARAFAEALVGPVRRARPGEADALLATLRAWLAQHGSWDRTAATLGLHRNTVRHRIGLLGELLDRDLNDAEVRMNLWFALSWLDPD